MESLMVNNKRMKNWFLSFILLVIPFAAGAYSFTSIAPTGQTLYYDIVSGGVSVTYPYKGILNSWKNFAKPSGKLVIPDTVTYGGKSYPIVAISNYAFSRCTEIASVVIPDGCKSIGNAAFFEDTSLTSVRFGKMITTIGDSAFANCEKIQEAILSEKTNTIGKYCFFKCLQLESVYLPQAICIIPERCFYHCIRLKSITLPKYLTEIGKEAFKLCIGIASLDIPSTVTFIGRYAFSQVPNINYYGTATDNNAQWRACCINAYYSDSVYYRSQDKTEVVSINRFIVNVNLPGSVQIIGKFAFSECDNIQFLELQNGVQKIAAEAFRECGKLQSLVLPSTIQSIGNDAFYRCNELQFIKLKSFTPPTILENTFYSRKDITIIVPCAAIDTYKMTDGWKDLNIICEGGNDTVPPDPDPEDSTGIANIDLDNITICPANGGITISNANGKTIDVFDIQGRTLYRKRIYDTEHIPLRTGMYIVRINGLLCRKVVVTK